MSAVFPLERARSVSRYFPVFIPTAACLRSYRFAEYASMELVLLSSTAGYRSSARRKTSTDVCTTCNILSAVVKLQLKTTKSSLAQIFIRITASLHSASSINAQQHQSASSKRHIQLCLPKVTHSLNTALGATNIDSVAEVAQ